MTHLIESSLQEKIISLFPSSEIIRNRKIRESGSNGRPDFYLPKERLVIEFDGYLHYSNVTTILRDIAKDEVYASIGLRVVHIPYFIQWCNEVVKMIQPELKQPLIEQTYLHGFIDPKAMTPANYCELGVKRFLDDINGTFEWAKRDIIQSLKKHEDQRVALPPSLFHLFE